MRFALIWLFSKHGSEPQGTSKRGPPPKAPVNSRMPPAAWCPWPLCAPPRPWLGARGCARAPRPAAPASVALPAPPSPSPASCRSRPPFPRRLRALPSRCLPSGAARGCRCPLSRGRRPLFGFAFLVVAMLRKSLEVSRIRYYARNWRRPCRRLTGHGPPAAAPSAGLVVHPPDAGRGAVVNCFSRKEKNNHPLVGCCRRQRASPLSRGVSADGTYAGGMAFFLVFF